MLPDDVTYEILQVLQMYAITPLGASFMLDGQSRAILIQAAKQDQAAFKILRRAFIVEVHRGQSATMLSRFHDTMSRLIDAFKDVPEMTAFFVGAFDLLVVIQPVRPFPNFEPIDQADIFPSRNFEIRLLG